MLLLGVAFSFYSSKASAQTCKVNIEECPDGCISYMEVFEYDFVDQKPEFPGGGQGLLNFINQQRVYPPEAYSRGIEGRVTCSFVVNTDGKLSNITILRGVEQSLNTEALRIISLMPVWTPGMIDGQAVPVRVICPVPFRK